MKAGIITYHFANNYGAALQTYALQTVLEQELGVEARVVDYRHWFIRFCDTVRLAPITGNPEEMRSGLKTFPFRLKRLGRFLRFQQKYLHLSSLYRTYAGLNQCPPDYDAFICGSDQIWNSIVTLGPAPAYYLQFTRPGQKRIAYAPCIGITDIKKKHLRRMLSWIRNIDVLSVREQLHAEMLERELGRRVESVIDPVFLMGQDFWKKFAGAPKLREPYILVYIMQNNTKVYSYAKKAKELLGLPVVAVSRYGFKADCVDRVIVSAGPEEFVNLFCHAAYVCTNSFHGLAFSLIFEKNVFVVPSDRFNMRFDNLQKVLGVVPDTDVTEQTIGRRFYDIGSLKNQIEVERKKGIHYLKDALEL